MLLVAIVTGANATGYSPSADEVIILNQVYSASATTTGYSTHSAIAWGGTASTNSKKAGDPNNGGAATSSNVNCYSVKGNGSGKNITISITGVSKIIIYHEKHSSRYVDVRDTNASGNIIGSGAANTYYTEVSLTGTTDYKLFLRETGENDFYVYAIKLIKYVPTETHSVTYKAGAGTGDDVQATTAVVGACPDGFTAPTGKSFNGWNTASDGTGDAYKVGDIVSSDLTLFAQWATFYSVAYSLGDATAGTVPTQADVADGGTFSVAAAPTDLVAPAGKEFKCWNDGTNDYDPGDTYTVGTSDITLTAVYQDKTYQGLTPSETLDFSNLGSTFSTMWFDNDGKMDNNFYFDAVNGKVVISAYAIYQSNASDRNLNLWATTDSGNSSTGTWTATGDFKGSTYYFNNDARAANIQASARVHYYRVTGITSVSALFNGKAAIEAYEVNSGVVFPDYAKQNKISSAGTATITELDADKEYVILVRGDNGTSGIRFYEIEFTFPAVTTETVTIPSEGFATYVTSSALDFSSQNGAFKAYVASGVNDAKTFVTTAEVTKVPAGTALLLKGAAGSYNVEITASADAVTNLLKASNGGVKGDNSTVFAYSKSAGKFKKVAQDVVIPAGKAYLKLAAAAANTESLDIDFDTATAVEAIAEANAEATAPVKVITAKGIQIGKFNVAGQQVR